MIPIVLRLVAGVPFVAFDWRLASRRWRRPCPSWLGWHVESPYVAALAGSATLLKRASIGPRLRVLDAGCGPGRVMIPAAEERLTKVLVTVLGEIPDGEGASAALLTALIVKGHFRKAE